ncbi:MAG: Spy/CpxP family protein refolding chaperone [Flavobacteriales bacterium]
MKYLVVILGIIFFTSCGKERKEIPPPDFAPEVHEEEMNTSTRDRDSIYDERKKKMLDRLTEKLNLTEEQIQKIKQLDEDYHPQLKELRKEMFETRKKHHQLIEEKRLKMKEILTSEQVEKLEAMRKKSKRKEHRDFKEEKPQD